MATIKLRDYLLALSSKGSSVDGDIITILDSADGNTIKTVLKSDLVDLDYLVSELQDDFLDQFGEGTFSGSAQVDHDATTNFVANEHIDHTAVSIIAGAGLTGGGDISSDRTIDIVSDNNGIVVNADQIELDTDSSTFSGGVLTKMNIEQVVSGSSQISADQTDGWVGDVKTQLNSNTVISGSSQVILNDADKTGFDTADVVEGTNLYYTDARVLSKINTEGVISGSTFSSPSQGTLTTTINGVSSNVDLGLQSGDNVTFVDGTFTGNVSINGNLDVLGDAVEIQTSELRIEDKLITVASGSADSAASDGAGLEIDGANKSLKWNHSTQQFVFDAKVSSSVGFKGEGGELTGIDTDQVTEAGNLYYTDTRVKTKLNTEGVLSGSAQIASDISGSGFVSATNDFEELTLTKGSGETSVVELSPKKVLELVKNKELVTLPKGTPVYVSGSTGNAANVYAASASREDRMPAAFVLDQQLTADQEGNGIALGFINGIDTSGFNEGDNVYVGISGGYTNVKPTGNSNRIQKLGNVIKSAINGSGVITGAGRSNDVPNIQQGFVWVGGPSDVSYQLSTSSLLSGNSVISGSSQIDVTLTTNYSSINQYTDSDNTSHLNSLGVISGSSQIVLNDADKTGFDTDDVTEGTNLYYTDTRVRAAVSATNGSAGYTQGTGVFSIPSNTSHVSENTNLYYTDARVKTKLNTEGVISGSSQVVSSLLNQNVDLGTGDITGSKLYVSGSTTIESDIRFDTGSLSQTAGGLSIYGTSATGSQYITTPGITFGWENNVSNVGISGYKATTSNTSPTNQVGMVFNTIYNGNSNDTMRLSGPSVYFNELSNQDTQLELFGNSYGPSIYMYHDDDSYSYMYSYNDYIGWAKKWGSGIANKPGGSGQSDLWMYRGNLTDAHDDYHEWKVAAYQKFKLGYTDSIISTNLEVTGDLDVNGDITGSSLSIIDTSNPGSDYGSVVIEGRRDGSPNVLTLRAKDNGTPASALPQDQGAVVRWQGFDGTDFANMGYILVAADGQAVAASDAPSYMAFGVSPDASETPSEVMRLDSDGVLSLNDTSNDVFINNNGTSMELDVNRHPETGVFSDTAKGHARISLVGDTGGSKIIFNTANAINTTATTVVEISSSSLDVTGDANFTGEISSSTFSTNRGSSNNTLVGSEAGAAVISGASGLTIIGKRAGESITTADTHVIIGKDTAKTLTTTGTQGVTIGNNALKLSNSIQSAVFIGHGAGEFLSGSVNSAVAIGNMAMGSSTPGKHTNISSVAVGDSALSKSPDYSIGIGQQTGRDSTGNNNVYIGHQSGITATTGTENILVGYRSDLGSNTDSNTIVIGTDTAGKGSNTGFINPNSGGVYQGNNSSAWSTTSDERLKKNIVDNNEGFDKIKDIRVRNFEYRTPEEITELNPSNAIEKEGVQLGVIAQELQEVLPECVKQESTGVYSLETDNLMWYMINSIKEQQSIINDLKSRIETLENS